jgi:hypothetical protein
MAHTAGAADSNFGDDLAFLKSNAKVIVLSDAQSKAMLVVVPAWQSRVLTSTADGPGGASFGWINRELIASHQLRQHINAFGGEDRLWLGPEGGQFSIFFAPGAAFDLDHWFTPAPLDSEAFNVVSQANDHAAFGRAFELTNWSGTKLSVKLDREIRLLAPEELSQQLGAMPSNDVNAVAYETVNRLTNAGQQAWTSEHGLLSLWVLGMFNASPATTVVIPIKSGSESELGKPVNTDYFGPVPPERLVLKTGAVFFKADAKQRCKIGISPRRTKPVLGSFDAERHVLTLIQFTPPPPGQTKYVNSAWKIQDDPFSGDVVNSYNDGPPPNGGPQLGNFYELESSSPAAALAPGGSIEHVQRTIHLQGPDAELDKIARQTLGVGVTDIRSSLP